MSKKVIFSVWVQCTDPNCQSNHPHSCGGWDRNYQSPEDFYAAGESEKEFQTRLVSLEEFLNLFFPEALEAWENLDPADMWGLEENPEEINPQRICQNCGGHCAPTRWTCESCMLGEPNM